MSNRSSRLFSPTAITTTLATTGAVERVMPTAGLPTAGGEIAGRDVAWDVVQRRKRVTAVLSVVEELLMEHGDGWRVAPDFLAPRQLQHKIRRTDLPLRALGAGQGLLPTVSG